MSGTIPPIPPPFGASFGNPSSPNVNRVNTMLATTDPINTTNTTNMSQSVVDENLPQLLDLRGGSHVTNVLAFDEEDFMTHEGPSDTRDTKIAALRLKFNAFKSLKGEKVNGTFTRLKFLLNELENNGVTIPQIEVNATFLNSLPRKWLSMNLTQRANNSIKNDSLATMYGKYNYEEGLIDQIYELETQRFTIQASSSKALIFNHQFPNSDSDVKEDQRTNNEFMADLNAEYHERALLANQKRFYKRSGRVGSARKPLDKTKETCFACGKLGHFQKDYPSHKTSTPPYPSSNNSFNKSKPYTPSFNQTSSQNSGNHQKNYKGKYKGLKAEMVVLNKRIDDITKGKSKKGKKDKEKSEKEDKLSVGNADARSGQWVDITMKKVHKLLSMTDGDERKHVLDYTHVDLHYMEDQRKNLNESLKDEIIDLRKVIEKWTCSKVTLNQLLSEQVLRNIVKALGGKGRRKEKISSKEVVFTKADESSSMLVPEITSDSESEYNSQEPLPPLPKLIGVAPFGTSESLISLSDLTLNMDDLTIDTPDPKKTRPFAKVSPTYVIKKKTEKSPASSKHCSNKKTDSSTEQLLLTLVKEDYLKRSVWYLDSGCSKHMTGIKQYLHRYSKELGPKVVFGDDSSGDTEGCGSVNYNGITFTKVAYVNGLKHNLINISQLCGANYKVLFTKTQGTIYNQNDEVVLIAPRGRDVYVIDMSSFNKESNAYFFAKASPSVNWLWHKRLSHLNFKNINNLTKHNLVSGLPSLSFKTKRSFSINKKIENLNEVRVKELRSNNGTKFRNHKLEEFCNEKVTIWENLMKKLMMDSFLATLQ
ncbi:retrovirus-related pol polyprotein from transposon TNT 1-94 [Tanacetum coccineum]